LRPIGATISADARAALVGLLGGDRQASRNEIRKLALYAHGAKEVTLADVAAIVTDASALALDPIIDGAFAGRVAVMETAYAKAIAAGTYPGQIIASAQRHAAQLHKARLALEDGRNESDALDGGFPRLHFSRRTLVEAALRNLSSERLLRTIALLADAALEMRRQADLAATIGQRALMAIAVNARQRH
jgi:DNA polymerase-3 subunit delta